MVLQMLSDKEEAEGGKQRVPITYLESKPLFWQLQFKIMCHSNMKYFRMLDFFSQTETASHLFRSWL